MLHIFVSKHCNKDQPDSEQLRRPVLQDLGLSLKLTRNDHRALELEKQEMDNDSHRTQSRIPN